MHCLFKCLIDILTILSCHLFCLLYLYSNHFLLHLGPFFSQFALVGCHWHWLSGLHVAIDRLPGSRTAFPHLGRSVRLLVYASAGAPIRDPWIFVQARAPFLHGACTVWVLLSDSELRAHAALSPGALRLVRRRARILRDP